MTVQAINYKGRKGLIGKVCFGNEGLAFFAGYNECACGVRGKILLTVDDARELAQKVGGAKTRRTLGMRLTQRLNRHYSVR